MNGISEHWGEDGNVQGRKMGGKRSSGGRMLWASWVKNEIKVDGRAEGNGIGEEERRDMSIQERKGDTSVIDGL